jgi:hypothetical protein
MKIKEIHIENIPLSMEIFESKNTLKLALDDGLVFKVYQIENMHCEEFNTTSTSESVGSPVNLVVLKSMVATCFKSNRKIKDRCRTNIFR